MNMKGLPDSKTLLGNYSLEMIGVIEIANKSPDKSNLQSDGAFLNFCEVKNLQMRQISLL